MNAVDEIKSRITIPELLSRYGIYDGNKNRIPCPIHGGKNPNFAFKEDAFICFKCGASGDVISFVQQYFDISFPDAVKRLQQDFALKPITLREKYEIMDRKKKKSETQQLNEERQRLQEECVHLSLLKEQYKPRSMEENLHPLFLKAITNMVHIEGRITEIEGRLWKHGTQR